MGLRFIIHLTTILTVATALFTPLRASADDPMQPQAVDIDAGIPQPECLTDSVMLAATEVAPDTVVKKKNIIDKVIDYFNNSNKKQPGKKLDISFLGGPSYSSSTSLELAVIAAGIYRTSLDSLTPVSDVSVYAEASIKGMYDVGIRGHHIFAKDKIRINYDANFLHFPSKFWGIGYDMESLESNESEYTLLQSAAKIEVLFNLSHDFFLGPSVDFNYSKRWKADNPELWNGEDPRIFNYGMGVVLNHDTRDDISNATKGVNLRLHQRFFPKGFHNDYCFSSTELTFAVYKKFWSSGVFAFQAHGMASYGKVPWSMLPTVDQSKGIRGYYDGRYRSRNEADIVFELRQKVYRRHGVAVWCGLGTVFDRFSEINIHRLLPSVGVGYRWEFKKNVNVRVDIGFGKHSHDFNIGINEAF